MRFRYKVKESKEYLLNDYIHHYTIIIQMFNPIKSKWTKFNSVDLGKMCGFAQHQLLNNDYLLGCVDAIEQAGGFDAVLKNHIVKVLKENDEFNAHEVQLQEAINNLNKMFSANKKWTVIELEKE